MSKMTPNPLRELARLRAQTETEPGHDYEFVAAALDITPDQWEAIAAVVEAARVWSELEAKRRIVDYGADEYDELERLTGEAATALIKAQRALDAASSQEVAGEAE